MAKLSPLIQGPFKALKGWITSSIWDLFWWVFVILFVLWVPFLRPWWWFITPILLAMELKRLYLWWLPWDVAYPKIQWTILEIIPPKEVLVPVKAMEDVFNILFSAFSDQANFREIWCEGRLDNTPDWMSFEIVSIEGQVHFLARIPSAHRSMLETTLYSYYPEVEIHEVPDYVRLVPHDIPNEQWDLYGEDFVLTRPAAYPIKTYEKFFEPQGEKISAEEKRIEPINSLLEMMSRLGPGEHYWAQFILMGAFDADEPGWRKKGEEIIAKLVKRPVKEKETFTGKVLTTVNQILFGPKKEGSGDKASYKWVSAKKSEDGEREMVLTPGEREIVSVIENKIKKPVFRTNIRGLYIARRENWNSAHKTILRSYMPHFSGDNLNSLSFGKLSRTKVTDLFRKRRVYLRSRKIIQNAILRFPPMFPDRSSECAILSTEEVATLFHFPVKISGITLSNIVRVESKKSGPPPNLPVE